MTPDLGSAGDWTTAECSPELVALGEIPCLPSARLDDSIRFLRWHAPEGLWVLCSIHPEMGAIDAGTFHPTDEKACRHWLEQRVGERNIYFHVNPTTRALKKKAGREDIASLAWLHVDIDPRAGKDLDSERAHALSLLQVPAGELPRPSAIIFSGGGYQGFWRLSDPIPIDGDLDRAEAAKRYNITLERAFGADNCHNVDRIMRLPGTINWPDARKAKKGRIPTLAVAVELTDATYSIAEFTAAPLTVELKETKQKAPTPLAPACPQPISSLADLDEWNVPARVKRIVQCGRDPEQVAPEAKDTSRSGWLWDAACNLCRSGVPKEIIISIFLDPRWKISESVLAQSNPQAYAAAQVRNASDQISRTWHAIEKDGPPKTCYPNARLSILRLQVKFSHDVFRDRLVVGGDALRHYAGEVSDHAVASLRQKILDEDGYDPGKQHVRDALHALCLDNGFDPVVDYLSGLAWDGQPRLDTWLMRYLGAADSPLYQAVGRKMLAAAVRRVFQPGCKFDYVPVLEGVQGGGKSTALRILAGVDDLFSDQELLHLDGKAQQEAVRGKWIYELSELACLSKAEAENVKAFLSRTHDRARPAYGYATIDQPRRCIFIGTTNERNYLRDPTGNRRFWPIATGAIELSALARDRDQLWAEAVLAHKNGEQLYLSDDLANQISAEQDDRREEDPWIPTLAEVIGTQVGDEERLGSAELLTHLKLLPKDRSRAHVLRLKDCMKRLGWKGPSKMRVNGNSVNGYSRSVDTRT